MIKIHLTLQTTIIFFDELDFINNHKKKSFIKSRIIYNNFFQNKEI